MAVGFDAIKVMLSHHSYSHQTFIWVMFFFGGLIQSTHCLRAFLKSSALLKKGKYWEKMVQGWRRAYQDTSWNRLNTKNRKNSLPRFNSSISANVCLSLQMACVTDQLTWKLFLAFFITTPPKQLNTPMSLHPPELIFQHDLTEAVDIWNLGSTVRLTLAPSSSLSELIPRPDLWAFYRPYTFRSFLRR